MHKCWSAACLAVILLQGCGGDSSSLVTPTTPPIIPPVQSVLLDAELRILISDNGLTGDPSAGRDLPSIDDPIAQLGKKLFFTKALGGDFDTACVSCHHPALGGADALSLAVGIGAVNPDLLGPGRTNAAGIPNVPRNSPTTFNIGLWDAALFFDSRVESLGKESAQNGAASGISTPDSGPGVLDGNAGANLVTAQARFPVTSHEEMRGSLESGASNDSLRAHLAARLGDYGVGQGEIENSRWLAEFQTAFASADSAENLITYDNIALAIAEYQRSQVFVDTAWRAYVQGDNDSIDADAKRGAILFYTEPSDGGAGCFRCHSGDFFTDGRHHATAAPQFGPGKGNGNSGRGDFGREIVTNAALDRFRFRTPSLLNIAVTAPYMHTGAYESLTDVLRHYANTNDVVNEFFDNGGWCQLQQFSSVQDCDALYPSARTDTDDVLDKLSSERAESDPDAMPSIQLDDEQLSQIVAFLETLTDTCVLNRNCLSAWISTADEDVDGHQLNAIDFRGGPL